MKTDGSVWAAGENPYGELGIGVTGAKNTFVQIMASGSGVRALAAGPYKNALIMNDGSLVTAGKNDYYCLGDGISKKDKYQRETFMQVMASGAVAASWGYYHLVVLKDDG